MEQAADSTPDADVADHLLVQRTAQGDTAAFEILVRRYQQPVANLAYRFLADAAMAQDIAQDTFIRVYQAAGRYRPDGSFKAYLLRITKNLCLDYLRKKKPLYAENPDAGETTAGPLEQLIQSETSRQVFAAVQSLPASQRLALLLQHFEDLSYRETAQVMETTVAAVESLLVRAKKNLREKLEKFI